MKLLRKKGEKRNRSISFSGQIVLILAAGVLVSLGVLAFSHFGSVNSNTDITINTENASKSYTVSFYSSDGSLIEKKEVKHGKGVLPPRIDFHGVFRGWDRQINSVTGDLEVHPIFYPINEDNLFFFNSAYVLEGEEFELPINLAGNVNVSSGELILEYDSRVLKYKGNEKSDIYKVRKKKTGKLLIKFESDGVIKEAAELAKLKFKAKEKDVYATEMVLSSKNIVVVSGDEKTPADNSTINNKIYFMQEVK